MGESLLTQLHSRYVHTWLHHHFEMYSFSGNQPDFLVSFMEKQYYIMMADYLRTYFLLLSNLYCQVKGYGYETIFLLKPIKFVYTALYTYVCHG